MDRGVFDRWGITAGQFSQALASHKTDDEVLAWLRERVNDAGREAANRWLTEEKSSNLDRQDSEEGAIAA